MSDVRRTPSRVFARGGRLYGKVKDATGVWRQVSTGYPVGRDDEARQWLRDLEWRVRTFAPLDASSAAAARWYPAFADPVSALVEQTIEAMRRIDRLCFPDGDVAPDSGYVYAIQAGNGGPVKLGRANAPAARLADIQRMNPMPLMLLGIAHGGSAERNIHNRHMKKRLHGEWFALAENPLPVASACYVCTVERSGGFG